MARVAALSVLLLATLVLVALLLFWSLPDPLPPEPGTGFDAPALSPRLEGAAAPSLRAAEASRNTADASRVYREE